MKIIDIAICVDNIDPKGMGRIRCVRYNDYVGEKENSTKYEKWSQDDPFIASPFLPNNINFVPENGQSVKLLNYNTDNENINLEYVAGPFTTQFDFNGQTFSQQIENTTYGVTTKHRGDIKKSSGEFIKNKSENSLAKDKDFAIYGKYGSDILFTENGLQLRGGKLLSKEAASYLNRETMLTHPLMSDKSSRLYLKKFPKKMNLEEVLTTENISENKDLNYIIEYDVNSFVNDATGYTISLYVYKVNGALGDLFKTNYFTENTEVQSSLIKLINDDNTNTTPTYQITVTSISDIYREIRDKIFLVHDKGLNELNTQYPSDDIHPFFFRPYTNFKRSLSTTDELNNKQTILNGINVLRIGPGAGLIWSATRAKAEVNPVNSIEKVAKIDNNTAEQTFGAMLVDKLYLLSTDLGTNESANPVPFVDLNGYELSQQDYIEKIEPSTFSTVRGENLLKLLSKMIEVIFTHRHNPLMPISGQYDYDHGNELKELFKTIENDILNKSIRIN